MADKNSAAALGAVLSAAILFSCAGTPAMFNGDLDGRILYSSQSDHPEYFDALIAGKKKIPVRVSGARGAIVSHHLLAGEYIAGLFASLSESRKNTVTKTVVIIGPDHFLRCRYPLTVTSLPWKTDTHMVAADSDLIEELVSEKLAFEDDDPFRGEHSVSALVPFSARYFPDARIVPLLFGLSSSYDDALSLAAFLREHLGDDAIVIISTDFSHDRLPRETAEVDAKSFYYMKRLLFEPSSLLCREVECDNKRGICALYSFLQPLCLSADYLSHVDSSKIIKKNGPVTSYYFVVFGQDDKRRALSEKNNP